MEKLSGKVQTHLIKHSAKKYTNKYCVDVNKKIKIINSNKLLLIIINTLLLLINTYYGYFWISRNHTSNICLFHFKNLFLVKYIKMTEPRTREDFLHCKC